MTDVYTDADITEMVSEGKTLGAAISLPVQLDSSHGQRRARFKAEGQGDPVREYLLEVRQAEDNPLDFSVIVAMCPNGYSSKKRFLIRRYNGKSHEHTNRLEGHRLAYDFHIHEATERYQLASSGPGRLREEGYAQVTDRYGSVESALDCAVDDCKFRVTPMPPPTPGQFSMLGGEENDH